MDDLKKKTVLVWDSGLFVEVAVRLSREFGRVLYYSPWAYSFPRSNDQMVGTGIRGVTHVLEPWSHLDDVDLFVFTDVYEGALQEYLIKQGKRVWGCAGSAWLELDRARSKEATAAAGIDIGPYAVVKGLDALREHLREHDDQHVKISATRGDMETFHSPTYKDIEPRLDELEHNLGAKKKIMEFIVEEGIPDAVEVGYDGYSIDGVFPRNALIGVEVKDKAYCGKTMRYSQLPKAVRDVNAKLSPLLKESRHRGFMSTEIRLAKEGAFLIDPCQRCGSPPSELYQNLIENLGEVIWYGAEGIVVEPEYAARWGVEVIMLSDWADTNWQQINFPKKYRDAIKLKNFCVVDGDYYCIPQGSGYPEIGAIVATGNTAKEAIAACREVAEHVHGYSVEKHVDALEEAHENLVESLGAAGSTTPTSKEQAAAEDAVRAGKISQRQFSKLAEKNGWA